MNLGSIVGLGAGVLAGYVALEVFYLKGGMEVPFPPAPQDPNAKGASCDDGKVCGPGFHCATTGLFRHQCIDTSFEVKRAVVGSAFVGGGALLGYWLGGKL